MPEHESKAKAEREEKAEDKAEEMVRLVLVPSLPFQAGFTCGEYSVTPEGVDVPADKVDEIFEAAAGTGFVITREEA